MARPGGSVPWLLVVLSVLLLVGMLYTLWAGRSGRIQLRHGVVGMLDVLGFQPRGAPGGAGAQVPPEMSSNWYRRPPSPNASARASCTVQSMLG